MKILTYIITIFLIFGLFGAPSSVFAQEYSSKIPESTLQHSNPIILESMVPLLRGGGGHGSSHSSSHVSKKVHDGDDDTSDTGDNSTDDSDDGSGWWITLIIIIIIIALIVLAVWYSGK
ncbi:hypothetical protein [Methanobacterium sp.]|uniref:hypothetical protein n=1 Tax=Methanobacterium sp. TaxID=2164 RepID=UPI003C7196FB